MWFGRGVRALIWIFFVGFLVLFICKDCAGIMAEISNSCAISTLRTTSQPLLLDYAN